jgi:threonine dehydrogenase-like Zn-dependent dehydrogenase
VAGRGDEAVEAVRELTEGVGADAVLECVGTEQSMLTAFAVARPGATVGFVGAPHGTQLPWPTAFRGNIGLRGGMAPVVRYLPELVPAVLAGDLDASAVFDLECPWTRPPRRTGRLTSGGRSRRCCGREAPGRAVLPIALPALRALALAGSADGGDVSWR